jgi:hypothetical protein
LLKRTPLQRLLELSHIRTDQLPIQPQRLWLPK